MQTKSQRFLKASVTPIAHLDAIAYAGQPATRRQYRGGYEKYFNTLPVLRPADERLQVKIEASNNTMRVLADDLRAAAWPRRDMPSPGDFDRTIIAIANPTANADGTFKEAEELVVARWGTGFSSPVHGHTAGYLNEQLLFGKLRVNTYRLAHPLGTLVRPVATTIIDGASSIANMYTNPKIHTHFKRQTLIHNFTAIEPSASLHYLAEHTRDGRDNRFDVVYFEDYYGLNENHFKPITAQEGLYLRDGEVALVRSTNVPEYGDHYIVITGRPVVKEHGLRPQDIAIGAGPNIGAVLDDIEPRMGLTLLKLNPAATAAFHSFHGITTNAAGQIIFPTA